jgi:rare lipoprotein A
LRTAQLWPHRNTQREIVTLLPQQAASGHGSACIRCGVVRAGGWYLWGDGMSSDCARMVHVTRGVDSSGVHCVGAHEAVASYRHVLGRLAAVTLAASCLAACAQSSMLSNRTAFRSSPSPTRQAALEHHRLMHVAAREPVSVVRRPAPVEPDTSAGKTTRVSQGIASFYSEGTHTASGEKFDANELTAAHPTLPFGTRLRVTNVNTGKSVTVRVNDRGPYVHGRVVDVSYSAAQALGMVGQGVAKVKLDVVQ